MSQLTVVRFVFAANQSLSNEQDARHLEIVAFHMPAVWTAASLSFQARPDVTLNSGSDDTLQSVYDAAGAEVTLTVAAAHYVLVPQDLGWFKGFAAMKLRSGTNAAPVVQTAAREILAVCKPMGD